MYDTCCHAHQFQLMPSLVHYKPALPNYRCNYVRVKLTIILSSMIVVRLPIMITLHCRDSDVM